MADMILTQDTIDTTVRASIDIGVLNWLERVDTGLLKHLRVERKPGGVIEGLDIGVKLVMRMDWAIRSMRIQSPAYLQPKTTMEIPSELLYLLELLKITRAEDVTVTYNGYGRTTLTTEVMANHVDCVELILEILSDMLSAHIYDEYDDDDEY